MSSSNEAVLLLNSTYEPLTVINLRRAIRLLLVGKGDSVESTGRILRFGSGEFRVPEVLRLCYYVKRPSAKVKFTKQAVFLRDSHTCQYCGEIPKNENLTIDHVLPKVRGGLTAWTNVVAACKRCNNSKGDRSLKDAGMKLARVPKEPRFLPYLRMVRSGHQKTWDKYLFTEDGGSAYLVRDELPNQ